MISVTDLFIWILILSFWTLVICVCSVLWFMAALFRRWGSF